MLAQADRMLADGMCPGDVCDALEISQTTYRRWRREFGGLTSAQAERVKDLEQEITTLRRLLRDAEREQTALLRLAVAHRSSAGRAPMTAREVGGTERTVQVNYAPLDPTPLQPLTAHPPRSRGGIAPGSTPGILSGSTKAGAGDGVAAGPAHRTSGARPAR
jgi:putative transposase